MLSKRKLNLAHPDVRNPDEHAAEDKAAVVVHFWIYKYNKSAPGVPEFEVIRKEEWRNLGSSLNRLQRLLLR